MKSTAVQNRPGLITALGVFFGAGAAISLTSTVALLFPESFLHPMWRLNPRALQAFTDMGPAAFVLLMVISVACISTAWGLWLGKLWGYRLAIVLFIVHLVADIYNVVSGTEPRAAIGIPIVAAILWLLARPRTKAFFFQRVIS